MPVGTRCARHQRKQHQGTTKNRPGDPFYSSKAWMRIRDARRLANPLCQLCEERGLTVAMHAVDHIEPRSERPDLALDFDNTRSLCESCHNRRTAMRRREKAAG